MKSIPSGVVLVALVLSCTAPRATRGLLEGNVPRQTLAPEGDLGFDRFGFSTGEISFPSGLRVAFEKTPARGMVGVVLAIDAGSTSDPEGREGLAHYAEHLAFRDRTDGIELGIQLHRLGALFNAETTLDRTTFHQIAPEGALPGLIEVAARLLQKPLADVDDGAAAIERDVVRNELMFRNETGVYGQLRGWLQTLLVEPGHPYRRPTGGTRESLDRLTLEEARRFAQTHYKPASASLLVVGDLAEAQLRELLEAKLPPAVRGDPAQPVTRQVGPVPLLDMALPAREASPPRHPAAVPSPELWLGYLLPGKFSRSAGLTRLIASAATEERLRDHLRAEPDVLAVRVVPLHDRLATILAVQVVLSSDRRRDQIAQSLSLFVAQLWRPIHPQFAKLIAKTSPPFPVRVAGRYQLARLTPEFYLEMQREQLFRLRQEGVAEMVHGLESWSSRALERAEYLQVMGQDGALLWAINQSMAMDDKATGAFAGQFLTPERMRVAYVDPLPVERRARPGVVGVTDRPVADDRAAAVDYGEPFLTPPPAELASVRSLKLENGLTVLLVPRPGFPAATSLLAFGGGAVAGDPAGVVEIVREMEVRAGLALPRNGLEAVPVEGPALTGELVRAGRRNLSSALYLLAQRIVDTDQTDWSQVLGGEDRGQTFVFRIQPEQKADHLLRRALYGDHPLGRPPIGPEVLSLRPEQVERALARMRSPRNALLVVVGDMDLAKTEQLVRGWFSSWKGAGDQGGPALPPVPAPVVRKDAVAGKPMIVNREGESQTQLVVACRLPPAEAGSRARHDLLASTLGSHLNTMVRHSAGAAYSVASDVQINAGGAAGLIVRMDVETRRVPEVLAAVRSLWTRLAAEGIDPGAISQSRWALSTDYNLRYGTSAELALALAEAWSLGWPVDSLSRYPADLRAASAADLNAAFATCRGSTVSVALGDEKRLEAALSGP